MFGGATEFGATGRRTPHDGDQEYHFVRLDDPSFPKPRRLGSTVTPLQL
ncbi:hypothetical protein IC762_30455 [Bradyrhizobium genosp. L]|nr:hypothetical protein IC762_30455 [Bradyrhizobium genosp. L]